MDNYKANEKNIGEKEKEGELNSTEFILDFKKVVILIGVGTLGYLFGKRDGIELGYVQGYRRCVDNITEILVTANKLR